MLDFKVEVGCFNEALRKFSAHSTIDISLVKSLHETVDLIEQLLINPTVVISDHIDVSLFQIHRQLYCKECDRSIKASPDKIREHINSKNHEISHQQSGGSNNNGRNTANGGPMANLMPSPGNRKRSETDPTMAEPSGKLSKRAKSFLKDYRLESLANKLVEEGEAVVKANRHSFIAERIVDALKPTFPEVKVYPFGSRLTKLGCNNSDLDLFVDLSMLSIIIHNLFLFYATTLFL